MDGAEVIMKKMDGAPISAGKVYNGDGALVTLGYFDQGSTANPFAGNWIPLTSGTKFGDSSTGYGYPDGHFFATSIFSKNSDVVEIFPSEPAYYETFAPHPITGSLPAAGTPICIRFYDSHELTVDTKYNTVTGPDWTWPAFSSGIPENLYLKVSNNPKPFNSRWQYGYTFQFPSTPAIASEPVNQELPLFDLNVNIVGNGNVSDHNASYKVGSLVELVATPNDVFTEFARWEGSGLLEYNLPTTFASITEDLNVTAYFQPKNFSISIEIEGTGDVTISGQEDGYNHFGDVIDLNASAPLGFVFSHWLGVGPDDNNSLTTLTVSQHHNLTAVFVTETYDLNVSVSSPSHGTAGLMEEGPYKYAHRYSLLALPNHGYTFSHWSSSTNSEFMLDDVNLSSTGVTAYEDSSFIANFDEIFNELQVIMSIGGASVSPASGTYSAASLIPVQASPLTGYEFFKWNDPAGVLLNPYEAQTDANLSMASGFVMIEALFKKKTYQVELTEGIGGNIVFDTPNGPWEYLSNYKLSAIAQPGYLFSTWSGNDFSKNSLVNGASDSNNSLIVTGDVNLTATFVEKIYQVMVNTTTGGEVSGSGTYSISNPPSIEAQPSTGWEFSHWEGNETYLTQLASDTSPVNPVNLIGAPESMTFYAKFRKITRLVDIVAIGGGTINGQQNLNMEFPSGTEISLIATPADGWRFDRWYDLDTDTPHSPTLSISPDQDLSFSALFLPNSYNLSLVTTSNGSASGGGTFEYGSAINISATPNTGFEFAGWEGGDEFINNSNNQDAVVTIPDQNLTLTANFVASQLNVNVVTDGSGQITGEGTYNYGETISLEATPASGNIFEKWEWSDQDGNQIRSSENPLSLILNDNLSITAYFITTPENHIGYQLLSSPVNAGIVFDDPSLRFWDAEAAIWERSLLAVANPGYSFLGWSSTPGLTFSPSALSSLTISRPTSGSFVTANFSTNSYNLKTQHESNDGSVNSSEGNFSHGEMVSLTATPSLNKDFSHWETIKSNDYTVTMGQSSIFGSLAKISIDGRESPSLNLVRGYTYEFNVQLEEDNPFYISTSEYNDDTFADEYLDGVPNSRITNGVLTFSVPINAPNQLFYHSAKYSYSGNLIRILTKSDSHVLPNPNDSEIKVAIDHDIQLKAVFKDKEHKLSITSNNGGSVNFSEGIFPDGATVSMTATPDSHYNFVRWEGNDAINGVTNPFISITMTEDENIRAVFAPVLYPLSVSTDPALSGVIETTNNQFEFPYGTEVEITLYPKSNYTFTNWSGKVTNPNAKTTTVLIESATEIVANLTQAPVDLAINPVTLSVTGMPMEDPNAGGTIEVPDNAKVGQQVLLQAVANEGFYFTGWYNQEGKQLSSAHSTYLTFSADTSISAIFNQKSVSVKIAVKDPTTGKFIMDESEDSHTELSIPIPLGEKMVIHSLAAPGYEFMKWTIFGSGIRTSGDKTLEVDATTDLEVEVQYRQLIPKLSIVVTPETSGFIPIGSGEKNQNGPHIIMAQPLNGYKFDRWEGEGIENHRNPTTVIEFNIDSSIKAVFKKIDAEYPISNSSATSSLEDWIETTWFGNYFWNSSMDNWMYHESLGWTYFYKQAHSINQYNTWLWINDWEDWIWISEDFAIDGGTYVYSSNEGWLFLDFVNQIKFTFSSAQWEQM